MESKDSTQMGWIEQFIRGLFRLTSTYKRAALERRMDQDPEVAKYRSELDHIRADIEKHMLKHAASNLSRAEYLDLCKEYGAEPEHAEVEGTEPLVEQGPRDPGEEVKPGRERLASIHNGTTQEGALLTQKNAPNQPE